MAKLSEIEGIGPVQLARLKKAKIDSATSLLKQAATPKGRRQLQAKSGIDSKTILNWVNRADLLQIKGIGSGYTELLVKAGVRSVVNLAEHEPAKLHQTLIRKNSALANPLGRLPGQGAIKDWVQQAKALAASEPTDSGGGRPR